MTAKEYLQKIEQMKHEIDNKKQRLKELKESMYNVKAVDYSRAKTSNIGYIDTMPRGFEQCSMLEYEIQEDNVELLILKHNTLALIHSLENLKYIELLFKKYVELKDFETIALEMKCTVRNIYIIHGKALKSFEKQHQDIITEGEHT
jgi:hypothetical protein